MVSRSELSVEVQEELARTRGLSDVERAAIDRDALGNPYQVLMVVFILSAVGYISARLLVDSYLDSVVKDEVVVSNELPEEIKKTRAMINQMEARLGMKLTDWDADKKKSKVDALKQTSKDIEAKMNAIQKRMGVLKD